MDAQWVTTGYAHTCLLTKQWEFLCIGLNDYGQGKVDDDDRNAYGVQKDKGRAKYLDR